MCCKAWCLCMCVAWSGGELTFQQRSVPESCSLNSCLGNKDKLSSGCTVLLKKKKKKADDENECTRVQTYMPKKRLTASTEGCVTWMYPHKQTQAVVTYRIKQISVCFSWDFAGISNLTYIKSFLKSHRSQWVFTTTLQKPWGAITMLDLFLHLFLTFHPNLNTPLVPVPVHVRISGFQFSSQAPYLPNTLFFNTIVS